MQGLEVYGRVLEGERVCVTAVSGRMGDRNSVKAGD